MCIHVHACWGTCLTCLHCNLWYSQQMMHYDDTCVQPQYQFSFLLPPPPAITSDLAVVPFWWTPFSVGFTYLKIKLKLLYDVQWKQFIFFFQNVCSFAIKCVRPSFCSPKVCSPLIPLPKILVNLILIQNLCSCIFLYSDHFKYYDWRDI